MTDARQKQLFIPSSDGRAGLTLLCRVGEAFGGAVWFSNPAPLGRERFSAEIRFDQEPAERVEFSVPEKWTEGRLQLKDLVADISTGQVSPQSVIAAKADFVRFAEKVASANRILVRVRDLLDESHVYEFRPLGTKGMLTELGRNCYP